MVRSIVVALGSSDCPSAPEVVVVSLVDMLAIVMLVNGVKELIGVLEFGIDRVEGVHRLI